MGSRIHRQGEIEGAAESARGVGVGGEGGEVEMENTWNGNEPAYLQIPQCLHPQPLNTSLRGTPVQMLKTEKS